MVSDEKSTVLESLFPCKLEAMCYFSLVALFIYLFFVCFALSQLVMMFLGIDFFGASCLEFAVLLRVYIFHHI